MNQFKDINRLIEKGVFDERLKKQNKKKERKIKIASLTISALIIIFLSVFIYQVSSVPKKISLETKENKIIKEKIVESFFKNNQSEINILALGRPGQGYSGENLTDTILLIHLEPQENKAILISLPRDLLVKIPNRDYSTKINALYNITGIEGLKSKIEEITGLTIDYHVLIDLVVTEEIIKLVDGLNVFVPQDINDPFFPGKNYSYETFNLSAGWRYLDGPTALKYIRTRYTSPNGDFDRMARQQQIINLLKKKVLALNLLWDFPTYLKIFNSLNNHIETDLGLLEMKSLWQTAKDIDINKINNLVIDKKETNLLIGGQVMFGNQKASVVYPKAGQENYEEIREFIKQTIQ